MDKDWKTSWSSKWKNVLIWLSGYLSIVAFAVVGGYTIVKSDNQECKKTAKYVLLITLLFTAIDIFLLLFSSIGGLIDGWYSSVAYEVYNIFYTLARIGKAPLYAACIFLEIFKSENKESQENDEKKETN